MGESMKGIISGFSLIFLVVLLIVPISLAGTTVFEGSQLTHNDIHDKFPQISANGDIVWEGGLEDWNVYLLKSGETEPQAISDTQPYKVMPHKWMYPKINSGGDVVWGGYTNDNVWEIFKRPGLSQIPVNVSNNTGADDVYPEINNNGDIVWESWDGTDWDIYFYEESSGTTTALTGDNDGYDWNSQINDFGDIVWEGLRGVDPDLDWEIFFWPSGDPGPTRLTGDIGSEDNGAEDWYPRINNSGDIVWQSYDGYDWEILKVPAGTTTPVAVTDNTIDDVLPKLNGNGDIVWGSYDGVDYYVNLLPAGNTTPIQVATSTWPVVPNMNIDKNIVWIGSDPSGNGLGIFLYRHSSGDVIQLSDNAHYDNTPQISDNGEVIWYGYDGNDWEIFLYLVLSSGPLGDDIHFYPRHLPFNSTKEWLKAYIELPEGYSSEDIIPESININYVNGEKIDPIYAQGPFKLGDRDNNGIADLWVRFLKSDLDPYIVVGDLSLEIIGELNSGILFNGNDVILVTD